MVGARFHPAAAAAPTILFFHGNGEIVADYDELAPFYRRQGVNFLPVDYRGYGRSTGAPTVSAMMRDCHAILAFARQWLPEMGYRGPLMVMGRSLGSASALELAAAYPEQVAALIVESGFAYAGPLLQLLGVNLTAIGFKEMAGFRNVDKIRAYPGPTLIIHAEDDHIIPASDGQALYDASAAADKTLLKIPHANHNDILLQGFAVYMAAIQALAATDQPSHEAVTGPSPASAGLRDQTFSSARLRPRQVVFKTPPTNRHHAIWRIPKSGIYHRRIRKFS